MRRTVFLAALCAVALVARADEDEDEAIDLVQNNCRICHGRELVESQRLTPAQWRAEVEKMARWGAPLAPEEIAPVVAYLARTLGPEVPERAPPTIGLAAARAATVPEPEQPPVHPPGSAVRGAATYRANCATCHGDPPLGERAPELVLRPILDRPGDFWHVLLGGRNRMPTFRGALPIGQLADVYAYLRSLREPPLAAPGARPRRSAKR